MKRNYNKAAKTVANGPKEEAKQSTKYMDNNISDYKGDALKFHNERLHGNLKRVQLDLREAISGKKAEIAAAKTITIVDFRAIYKLQVSLNLLERELLFQNELENELF